jgi:hypothetical protein
MLLNMPPIFPQMHGDPICAGLLSPQRCLQRIRHFNTARLPHRRYMIDVDAQTNH